MCTLFTIYYLWGDLLPEHRLCFSLLHMDAHCETGAELVHVWLSSVDNNNNNTLIIITPPPLLTWRSQGRGEQGVRGERPLLERWVCASKRLTEACFLIIDQRLPTSPFILVSLYIIWSLYWFVHCYYFLDKIFFLFNSDLNILMNSTYVYFFYFFIFFFSSIQGQKRKKDMIMQCSVRDQRTLIVWICSITLE